MFSFIKHTISFLNLVIILRMNLEIEISMRASTWSVGLKVLGLFQNQIPRNILLLLSSNLKFFIMTLLKSKWFIFVNFWLVYRCEPFPTYPRTYDMLHGNGLISHLASERCNMIDLFLEMDRILRPEVQIQCRKYIIYKQKNNPAPSFLLLSTFCFFLT